MNTIALRQQLHQYVETADDKKIKAIYTIVQDEIGKSEVEYSEELKADLDRRYASYKKNPSSAITAAESKKRIHKLLKVHYEK